jgi:hypothetical protein
MSTAGTLLSDLDSKSPASGGGDEDLVNKILADMNSSGMNPVMQGGHPQGGSLPPAPSGRVISSPNPNSTYPIASDPATATAHMIGKDYPTPADFASLMSNGYAPSPQMMTQMQMQQQGPVLAQLSSKGNWYSEILNQLRQPILVALIVFIMSLPIIHVLIGHYLPNLLRPGGDLTTLGLVLKSAVGGSLFWFINKVLVPLVAV